MIEATRPNESPRVRFGIAESLVIAGIIQSIGWLVADYYCNVKEARNHSFGSLAVYWLFVLLPLLALIRVFSRRTIAWLIVLTSWMPGAWQLIWMSHYMGAVR